VRCGALVWIWRGGGLGELEGEARGGGLDGGKSRWATQQRSRGRNVVRVWLPRHGGRARGAPADWLTREIKGESEHAIFESSFGRDKLAEHKLLCACKRCEPITV